MNFARVGIAGGLSVVVTVALLFLMQSLINSDLGQDEEPEDRKIADIHMPDTEIETQYEAAKPEKPEDPNEPPPDIPEPEFDSPDVDASALNMAAPSMGLDMNMGTGGNFSGDGEYMPIVAVAPEYPRRAAQRGIEGFVTVSFTVTTNGSTRDVVVVDAVDTEGRETSIFNRAAIRAAERFKFRPRTVDGEPVEVAGVSYRFVFELADE
ncbi:energy transducer TonB [Marinimicrobium sp. C6131]|uniref:energy transducer TonB n=1 Tax=Marinimicrobium sp. C6131 TaxID=3022676 RepID=UPI00223CF308|nr:energy transducer TonB [Marinimicrobium sp. C6131]UZJ43281.1 energy transducer TonB [Marinimicrobium sp. C6131]